MNNSIISNVFEHFARLAFKGLWVRKNVKNQSLLIGNIYQMITDNQRMVWHIYSRQKLIFYNISQSLIAVVVLILSNFSLIYRSEKIYIEVSLRKSFYSLSVIFRRHLSFSRNGIFPTYTGSPLEKPFMCNVDLQRKRYILQDKQYKEKNTVFACFKTHVNYLSHQLFLPMKSYIYIAQTQHFCECRIRKDQI